jgi:hypothetical protein
MGFRSVFCSNLLEHVENREEIARALTLVVPAGGYLFVSCPYRYPYHPDPIDTLFRPTPHELAALFPRTRTVLAQVVDCGTYAPYFVQDLLRNPLKVAGVVLDRILPARWRPRAPAPVANTGPRHESLAPWLFKKMKATCVVLQKE